MLSLRVTHLQISHKIIIALFFSLRSRISVSHAASFFTTDLQLEGVI